MIFLSVFTTALEEKEEITVNAFTSMAQDIESNGYIITEEQSFWEHIKYKLQQFGLFTAAGQSRGCSIYPDYTYNPALKDQTYPKSAMLSDAGCSDSALINHFDSNWIFKNEYEIEQIGQGITMGSSGILEVYCCPYSPCDSNSDCNDPYGDTCSQVYGSCYYDLPSHVTDVYKCDGAGNWDFQENVAYSDNKWCASPSDEHYIRQGDVIGGCYSSGPSNWCVEPSTGPGPEPGPTPDDDLSNIIEVSYIDIPDSGESSNYGSYDEEFRVTVKNTDTKTRTVSIEAGFYTYDYADNVAQLFSIYSIVSPVETCVNEPFVKQVDVTLNAGESKRVIIKMSPTNAYVTLPLETYILEDIDLVPFLGVMTHEGENACCKKLPGFEGCAEGTGGYIDFDYNEPYFIGDTQFAGSQEILCDDRKYGLINYKLIGDDEVEITRDYKECVDFVFYSESGEVVQTPENTNKLQDIKKLALTKSQISKSTSQDLLYSACLGSSECGVVVEAGEDYEISCISITKLREEGIISQATQDNFFDNVGTIVKGTSYGVAGGVLACGIGWATAGFLVGGPAGAVVSVVSLLANPATLGGCGAVGGLLGGVGTSVYLEVGLDDDLLKALEAENADAVGICVKESKGINFDTWLGWAAWFDVTGDGEKDGVDGLIIILIGGMVLFLLLRRR